MLFLDANVLVYAAVLEPATEPCRELLVAAEAGRLSAVTSTAVLEEVWHLELRGRPAGLDGIALAAYHLLAPLVPVTDAVVRNALALDLPGLGANDRIHVATCHAEGIDTIVSADASFDGVPSLRRIDPLNAKQIAGMLLG